MPEVLHFIEILKLDQEQHIVEGFAAVEIADAEAGMWKGQQYDGDLIEADAIKAALPGYMEWANIREMHQPSAVGTVLKAEVIDGDVEIDGHVYHNPLHIVVKIVDENAWQKVKEGVYRGFSIAGKLLKAVIDKIGERVVRRITALELREISLVDRPANPDARILVWKVADGPSASEQKLGGEAVTKQIAKAADPGKALGQLQTLRNDAEMGGDLESAALYSQAIALLLQAAGEAEPETPETPEAEPEMETAPEGEETMDGGDEEPVAMMDGAPEGEPAPEQTPEDEQPVEMAQKPGNIQKVGRPFAKRNADAMHSVIKSLATMLAGSGDETAQAVLKCYGGQDPQKAIQPDDIRKSVSGALADYEPLAKAVQAIDGLSESVAELTGRIEKLESQPVSGGPVLRPAEKIIAGQAPGHEITKVSDAGDYVDPEGLTIDDLRKRSATEPNVMRRMDYTRRLVLAEQNTVRK